MNFEELYAQLFDNQVKGETLSTGWKKFDQFLGGGFGAELVAFSGRPLHGKSTFLLNLMLNYSYFQKYKGMLIAPMSNMPSLVKYLASIIRNEEDPKETWSEVQLLDCLSDIKSLFLNRVKVEFQYQNMDEVLTQAKLWKASYLILDDFYQIMGNFFSAAHYYENLCKLKEFSQEAGIPVFISVMAQSSVERRGGPQEPRLMDIYRSDLLAQQAHKILMLYHPMVIGITEDDIGMSTQGRLEVTMVKNSLGKSGTLIFDMKESGRVLER
ncbi:DnaB-like helicase C-terminal domain-containing protein [Shivajiella indica]|uniref:DnaB-like helicase C-terminal domain-containing protein n=1 Tax=Shivajiella indica TaxID=872115 RepID=A0ABW5B9J4_9BACT